MELFAIGPAGCGKSSFVKAFSGYLQNEGYQVHCVNLDPATPPIYSTTADIRTYMTTEEIMKKYSLGINSALIKSVELSHNYVDNLKPEADYLLYDTPGQMELFIFSESGRKFVEALSSRFTAGLFLMDLSIIQDPESFLSAIMQNVIVSLRLTIPTLTVFTKSDVVQVDIDHMMKQISEKSGLLAEILEKIVFFIEYTTIPQRTIQISNMTKTGFYDLFSAVNELFCACGDIS